MKNSSILYKSALVHEIGGDRRAALEFLERALAAGYPAAEVTSDPEFVALRRDSAYRRIQTKYTGK